MTLVRLQRRVGIWNAHTPTITRVVVLIVSLLLVLVSGRRPALAKDFKQSERPVYRDGVVLLAFQNGIEEAQQKAILSKVGAREVKRIGVGVHVVEVKPGRVPKVVQLLQARREVRFAEPDFLQFVSAGSLPNDTFVGSQWAAQNTGQSVNGTVGTAGADERSLAAWGTTTGSNSVVVAVLDTGVQYSHPDLFTNMWNNPGGIGGCPAGTHGYNILSANCDPMDDDTAYNGHGSHVAGIIGAVGNNAAGTVGVNWTTSIMSVKWVNGNGSGATSDLIKAMDWVIAAKQAGINVRVANDSQTWVGVAYSQALSDEIDLLGTNDILFVTASGNTAQNNDSVPRYACSYARPTEICAAASDQNDKLMGTANFGPVSVQIAAPGVNIFSTLRSNNYGYVSGGSMAAAQTSGAAALILSLGYQPVSTLRSMIVNNVDVLSSLSGLVGTGGRLNVCKAVPGCATAVAGALTNSGLPVVTSFPQQGGLLGASTGFWKGVPSTYTYQWNRCDANGLNCSAIPGATRSSYALLSPSDPFSTISVTVTASNSFGSSSAQSLASAAIASATSASPISSSIVSGTTVNGTINWSVTPARSELFVQFYIDGVLVQTSKTSPYVYNSGVLDTTTLTDGTHVLGARALFTDNRTYDFYGESITVANPAQNTSPPVISGTVVPGHTITTTNGGWVANSAPTSFVYHWEHCDSNGLNCSIISGGPNSSSYALTGADTGFTMRCSVTGTNVAGSVTVVSAQTTVVPLPPLLITTTSLPTAIVNNSYSTTVSATGGIPPYTWSIASGTLPSGLTLAPSTGVISGTPPTTGSSSFTVQVKDKQPATTPQALTLLVTLPAPVIVTTSLPTAGLNAPYSATLSATGGFVPYTWSITAGSLPPGLSLASSTGVISGTASTIGTSNFTVQVSDNNARTGSASFSINVTTAPAVTTLSLPISPLGQSFSATLAAAGGTLSYSWSVASGNLPAGLTLGSNGVISGTPTSAGTNSFTAQVTDANSLTATKAFNITITNWVPGSGIGLIQANAGQGTGVTSLLVPFSAANSSGNLILAFVRMSSTTQTVSITDSLGDTFVEAVGQVQSSDGSQAHLFYAKNVRGGGPNSVMAVFSASNSHPWLGIFEYAGLDTAHPLDQIANAQGGGVSPNVGPTFTTTNPNELVFVGFGFSSYFNGSQIPGTGYSLVQTGNGTSPAGTEAMLVSATGSFSATYNLGANSNWSAVMATFVGTTININTNSLANATQNGPYNATLAATGGTPPLSWSIASGTLPAGLSLAASTGVISGTPSAAGTSNFTVQLTDANSSTSTKTLSLTVVGPPVVTTTSLAGGTQSSAYSATVAATGGMLPYTWSISSGSLPAGLSISASTGAISGTPTASGASNFTVQVSDANSVTATQVFSINVAAPPAISTTSLSNSTQNVSYSATLAATGGTTPYSWSISSGSLPAGLSLAPATGVISGSPSATGTSNFTVQVTDANSVTATQALTLVVVLSPSVTTSSLPGSTQNISYTTTLAVSGGTAPYSWSITSGSLPAGLSLAASTGVISGTPTGTGTSNFTVQVSDANSQNANKALSLAVAASPAVTTSSLPGGTQNVAYSAPLAATGGTLPYTWSISSGSLPPGLSISATTGAISGTPTSAVTSNFVVQVSDANAATATQSLSVVVVVPPSVTTTSLPGGTQNVAYSATLGASGGTPPYTWSVSSGTLPTGLSLDSGAGVISGTPTGGGASNFTVRVTDANSVSATQALSISILVPPAVTTTSLPSGTQNVVYSATLAVSGGTAPYSWSITSGSLPAGLTLAPSSGIISGTPTTASTSSITVQVTDTNSMTAASGTLSLTIAPTPPPNVTTAALPSGTQNVAYSATLAATSGAPPYSWSVTVGALPAGLTLAPATGAITGTPSATGSSSFTVQVTDANSSTGTKVLSINIVAPPAVTTASLPGGTQNVAYSSTLAVSGGTAPYSWSVISGTLPAGLSLAAGTGTISGSPSVAGTGSFTVQVTDANSVAASQALSITIVAPPAVTTASLPSGTQNAAYSATLAASGGTTPYSWTVTSGTLPSGLSLASGTGVISGTPAGTGTSNFTLQVSDANSVTASKALSITIVAPPAVTTTSLPGGTPNNAYSATLLASGGTLPYIWSLASGTLPGGLALAPNTGVISGTPTAAGTSNFTVQVTDANALIATKALSIAVTTSSGGGIGLVQANSAQGSAVGSLSVPFPAANTAGNLIIAFVRMSSSSQTVTLSDTAGNVYVQAVAQVQNSDGSQIQLFYAKNVLGAANTVKAMFSATNNHPWLAIYEYKGLNTANPLDQTAQAQGNVSALSIGPTGNTTSANELVFAGFGFPSSYSGTQAAGSGFTMLQNDTATSPGATESMIVSTTGTYTATFTVASRISCSGVVATFKP